MDIPAQKPGIRFVDLAFGFQHKCFTCNDTEYSECDGWLQLRGCVQEIQALM